MERLLAADEAAALFGVTRARMYALARANIVPAVRLGRLVRFCPLQLAEWLRIASAKQPTDMAGAVRVAYRAD